MPGYIVFVRFFFDYPDDFPFDRIARLDDEKIGPALKKLRKDSLKKPANGIAVKKTFQPDMISWVSDELTDGISRRYPLTRFDAEELAETACKAIQRRVGELARAALNKTRFAEIDSLFASANPRFFVLSESQLLPAERISAHAQITRIFEPVGSGVTLEEWVLRVFLPEIQPTLSLVRADEPRQPTHSEDFTSVCWFDTPYKFSKGNQAESVRLLFEAWKNKAPTLSEKTIGDRIDSASENFQLAKVFRKKKKRGGYEPHPAWGTMIQRAGKGMYQLVEPQKNDLDQES